MFSFLYKIWTMIQYMEGHDASNMYDDEALWNFCSCWCLTQDRQTRAGLTLISADANAKWACLVLICSPLTSVAVCQQFARPWSCCAAPRSESSIHSALRNTLTFTLNASQVLLYSSFVQSYGVRAGSQQCSEAGGICAICQADFREPVLLLCQVRICPALKRL